MFCTRLGVGKFSTLQGSHVTSQSKLLAVQPLQILLPLHDLAGDLALGLCVAHHALLQVGHVLQLVVLQHAIHTHRSRFTCNCHFLRARLSFSPPPCRRRSIFNPSALSPQRSKRQAGRQLPPEIEPRENTLAHSQPDLWIWPTPLWAQVLAPLLTARCLHSHAIVCLGNSFFSPAATSISHWAGLVASRANQ